MFVLNSGRKCFTGVHMFPYLLQKCRIVCIVFSLLSVTGLSVTFGELVVDVGDDGIVAMPNPVEKPFDQVRILCRTRCSGTALLNIYDAVGRLVHSVTKSLEDPEAIGYELLIPWDLRNNNERLVANGTYHCVVRIYDTENRLVARKKVNIGVACMH